MSSALGPSGKAAGGSAAFAIALILAVTLALCLPGMRSLPLCDPQESRCGMTVAAMLKTASPVVPRLGGEPYFEKPPLFFWLAAAATGLTGDVELGGRAVAALAAAGVCLCVYFLGRRAFSARAGLLGGLVLAVSLEHIALARWYRMDMLFVLFLTLALTCFWLGEQRRGKPPSASEQGPRAAPSARAGRAWYGFYLFAALAVMTKGPLGLILPLGVVVAYLLAGRQWRRVREVIHPRGLLLFAVIALPWFAYMTCSYWPDYPREFFLRTHLHRATEGNTSIGAIPGLYLPVLAAGFFPWTLLLPAAAMGSLAHRRRSREHAGTAEPAATTPRPHLFLWVWAVFVWVFFELSRTKFIHYVLPAFAPLALLVGEYLCSAMAGGVEAARLRRFRWPAWAAFVGAGAVPVALTVLEIAMWGKIDLWMPALWVGAAATMILIRHSIVSARPGLFVATLVASMTFTGVFVGFRMLPRIYSDRSLRSEGLAAAGMIPPGDRLYIFGGNHYSFYLYAGRLDARRYAYEQLDALAAELQRLEVPATVFYKGETKLHFLRLASPGVVFGPVVPVGRNYNIIRVLPRRPAGQ